MDFGWFENIMRDGERETCSVVVLLLCVCYFLLVWSDQLNSCV